MDINEKDSHSVVDTEKKLTDFERGRKIGRLEGMIAYQKHLTENLQKENQKLTVQLKALCSQDAPSLT